MRILKLLCLPMLVSVTLFLAACQAVTPSAPTATPVPPPEAGMANITGRLIDLTTGRPIPSGVAVRLAEVRVELDMWIDDQTNGKSGLTDEQGKFTIANVKPGSYVIVVGFQEAAFGVVQEGADKARIFDFEPDKTTDVGELAVALH